MIRVLAVVLVALAVVAPATAKTKPKPWAWTTAAAVLQVERSNPSPWGKIGTVKVSKCVGKGKQVARRYLAFSCSITFEPRMLQEDPFTGTLFVKVRPTGKGQPCVSDKSLSAVPKGCLNPKGARTNGDRIDVATMVGSKIGPASCLSFGAGYFECSSDTGHAIVVMSQPPVITVG